MKQELPAIEAKLNAVPEAKEVTFFENTEGLINGSVSPSIETDRFNKLTIYRIKPEDCTDANTALFLDVSPNGSNWFSIINLCSLGLEPQTFDVVGAYYRIRISFMNILDSNPKLPITVYGFLSK